jgi:hypothetical protein
MNILLTMPVNLRVFCGLFLFIVLMGMEAQTLRINEFMASNDGVLLDEDGDSSDWIEIWNEGRTPVSLGGLTLTDDLQEPDRWLFPEMELGANGYLVVFASSKDRRTPGRELHTNFELDRNGEALALMKRGENGYEPIEVFESYPRFRSNVSYGLVVDQPTDTFVFFKQPTPGSVNRGTGVLGFVRDTTFSVDRGYYDEAFDLVITTPTPGATIVYTLDGTIPSTSNGIRVTASGASVAPQVALRIESTTLIRAMAFKNGFEPTDVDTQSYLFHQVLLQQDGRGEPYSQSVRWGHAGEDWEMDPQILQHTNSEIRPVKEDFLRLPTLSVVMDFKEMFGSGGIYIAGQSVERDMSAEWINPDGDIQSPNQKAGFQHDGTIQIVGGSSPSRWKSDKLSMRLKFSGDLRYPVFGEEATDRFDTLVLDARLNNVWHYGGGVEPVPQRDRAQYTRDQYAANLHQAMGGFSPHGRHAHIMINGVYWGIHTVHERPDDNFAASYLGGDNEDYDVVKHGPDDVLQGSSVNYRQLHNLAGRDLSDAFNYAAVEALLDIDAFIDYMIMNYYIGNGDWAHHNWYASFNRNDPNGRWRFHSWDAEKGLHNVTDNVTGRNDNGGPTYLHHQLVRNEAYRLRFADHAYEHLRYGVLTPEQAGQLYREISDPIDLPIRLESARWGDNQRGNPYTRLDWMEIRDSLYGQSANRNLATYDYFNRRSEIVLNQFKARNWLPSIEPPTFNQHGGHVSGDFRLSIQSAEAGTIYYTTDGTDPLPELVADSRTAVDLVAETAMKRAIMPTDDSLETVWNKVTFNDAAWTIARAGAGYENSSGYEPFLASDFDFGDQVSGGAVESIYMRVVFQISDPAALDLLELGMRYDDGFIAYLNGQEIARANAPGSVGRPVAWNASASGSHSDAAAAGFEIFDVTAAKEFLKEGENVLAIHGLNVSASSSDFLIWPILKGVMVESEEPPTTEAGIQVYESPISLTESATVKARIQLAGVWSPILSADFVVDAVQADASNVVLSAIHYHPGAPTQTEMEAGFDNRRDFEFLRLTNVSDQTVDLRGVTFTSGIDFAFTPNVPVLELAPGESLVLCSNPEAYQARYRLADRLAGAFENGTNLNNGGERITLVNAVGEVIASVTYGDQAPWPNEADGNGYFLSLLPDATGEAVALPESWIIVSEQDIRLPSGALAAFREWLSLYFSSDALADPAVTSWTSDPDGDGMNHFQEYFHGSDPSMPGTSPNWPMVVNDPNEPAAGWVFEFTKSNLLPGVTWEVQTSTDLLNWSILPAGAPSNVPGGQRFSWNAANSTAQYFRLSISVSE